MASVLHDVQTGVPEAQDAKASRIFCANCVHCKLLPQPAGNGRYYLRVRCDAGKWRKKLGEEKLYKYYTVAHRSIDSCDAYEDMGDDEFIQDLRTSLPAVDELYGSER
ncbi:MAG TPA: hypothetical protein PLC54_05205 [Spirochaetales bacterium]|nr:hypothetical protein [Spirochaetales bacterium]